MKKILLIGLVLFLVACEQNGVVDIDSCVETIKTEEGSMRTYFDTFTCTLDETEKEGIHRGGICAKVETNENNQCRKVYVYEKSASIICPEKSYLANSGECECASKKLEWNNSKTMCAEKTCIENAELSYKKGEYECYCLDNYKLTEDGMKCVFNTDLYKELTEGDFDPWLR